MSGTAPLFPRLPRNLGLRKLSFPAEPLCHNGAGTRSFWARPFRSVARGAKFMSTSLPAKSTYSHLTWETILKAHARIAPRIHRTLVLTSASLDGMTGARLYFKCENLQKTGSFKIRGATNAIFSLSDEEASRGIVTQSSGNHGAAVACAATWRGAPAFVVMPKNAPQVKVRAIETYGGKITFCEPKVSSRNEVCARVQSDTGAVLIHPFDNDQIIAGQATAAKELLEEVPDLDAVFTPVSGGGLLSGTCLGAKGLRPGIRVFGCEPERADDAYRSLSSGRLQSLESSDTIADGLRASLAPRTFAILRDNVERVLLVSEAEIIAAMRTVWERMKIIIEPSSAVAIAPLLKPGAVAELDLPARPDAAPPKLGVIFSGGNVDLSSLPF